MVYNRRHVLFYRVDPGHVSQDVLLLNEQGNLDLQLLDMHVHTVELGLRQWSYPVTDT